MTFFEAAVEVLRRTGRPLHFKKITEVAVRDELLSHVGKAPDQTMSTRLIQEVKRHGTSVIVETRPGVYTIRDGEIERLNEEASKREKREQARQKLTRSSAPEEDEEEVEAEAAEEEDNGGERKRRRSRRGSGRSKAKADQSKSDQSKSDQSKSSRSSKSDRSSKSEDTSSAKTGGRRRARGSRRSGGSKSTKSSQANKTTRSSKSSKSTKSSRSSNKRRSRSKNRRSRGSKSQNKSSQNKSSQNKSSQNKSSQNKSSQTKSTQNKRSRSRKQQRTQKNGGQVLSASLTRHLEQGPVRLDGIAQAAYTVLQDGNTKPVDIEKLANEIFERKLVKFHTHDAAATVQAALANDNQIRRQRGHRPLFTQYDKQRWGLTEWGLPDDAIKKEQTILSLSEEIRQETLGHLGEALIDVKDEALEHIALTLLERLGYQNIKVSKRSSSGDVYFTADWRQGLADVRVCIQVTLEANDELKNGAVSALRETLHHYSAAEGVIIHLGDISKGAIGESRQDDKAPITLIDRTTFVELLIKHGIGVQAYTTPILMVDTAFIETLKS